MHRLVLLLPLSVLSIVCSSAAIAADSMRCGSSLVTSESTVAEILAKCGEPTSKTETTEDVRVVNPRGGVFIAGKTKTEKWTYVSGTRQFPIVITIVDGEVTNLETQTR